MPKKQTTAARRARTAAKSGSPGKHTELLRAVPRRTAKGVSGPQKVMPRHNFDLPAALASDGQLARFCHTRPVEMESWSP